MSCRSCGQYCSSAGTEASAYHIFLFNKWPVSLGVPESRAANHTPQHGRMFLDPHVNRECLELCVPAARVRYSGGQARRLSFSQFRQFPQNPLSYSSIFGAESQTRISTAIIHPSQGNGIQVLTSARHARALCDRSAHLQAPATAARDAAMQDGVKGTFPIISPQPLSPSPPWCYGGGYFYIGTCTTRQLCLDVICIPCVFSSHILRVPQPRRLRRACLSRRRRKG